MSFRSSTDDTVVSGTTRTVSKPAGVVDGDILMVCLAYDSNTSPNSVPAGWTIVAEQNMTASQNKRISVYQKEASGEGVSWDWSWATATSNRYICLAYDSETIISGSFQTGDTSGEPLIVYSSLANALSDVTVVYFEFSRWFDVGTGNNTHVSDAGFVITTRVEVEDGPPGATRVLFWSGDQIVASGNIPIVTNSFDAGPNNQEAVCGIRTASSFTLPSPTEGPTYPRGRRVKVSELPYQLHTGMMRDPFEVLNG